MNKAASPSTADKLLGQIDGLIRRLAAAQESQFGRNIADDVAQSLRLFAVRQIPAYERFLVKYPKMPFGAFVGSVLQKEAFAVAKLMVNTVKIPERNKERWGFCDSMDCPISGDEGGETTLHDVVPGERGSDSELPRLVAEAFSRLLADRDRDLASNCLLNEKSLSEFGHSLGISRERTRQLKDRVISVLRADRALAEYAGCAGYAVPS